MNASPIGKQRCPCGMTCEFLLTIGSSYIGQGKCQSDHCGRMFFMGIKKADPPRPGYGPTQRSDDPMLYQNSQMQGNSKRTRGDS